jgi:predicted AAA+ superfamily ATPase
VTDFNRLLPLPEKSFFLLGPRSTGKSTWLKANLPHALRFDLLRSITYLELLKNPNHLREVIEAENPEWVVIDEVQKIPNILDEVHALIFDFNGMIKFALTGSSARKLKKENANLLAGRALTKNMFPLTLYEIGEKQNIDLQLQFGTLPEVCNSTNNLDAIEYLSSYVQTYLKEEIQQETKVRDLAAFSRFLNIAAIMNGQILNLSNIARESGLARSTVQGHFQILIDTLLGSFVEPYRPKAKVKEVSSPKFYFFDSGIVSTLKGNLNTLLEPQEKGFLLETLFLNELRAVNSYHRLNGEIYFWRTSDGNEVDFIFKRGKEVIGFEIKSAKEWKKDYQFGLETLLREKVITKGFGIYLGDQKLKKNEVTIYPLKNLNLFDILKS